jgi:hypothetical protein
MPPGLFLGCPLEKNNGQSGNPVVSITEKEIVFDRIGVDEGTPEK